MKLNEVACPRCRLSQDVLYDVSKGRGYCEKCKLAFAKDIDLSPVGSVVASKCQQLADSKDWVGVVLETWPGPIAQEYHRLRELLRQGMVADAAWLLKDLGEVLIRIPTCVMIQDILKNDKILTNDTEQAFKIKKEIHRSLLGKAPTMNEWLALGQKCAIYILGRPKATLAFPEIAHLLSSSNDLGLLESLVAISEWRNSEFGHGALKLDYIDLVHGIGKTKGLEELLKNLHAALSKIADIWNGIELRTESGFPLMGCNSIAENHKRSHNDPHVRSLIPIFLRRVKNGPQLGLAPYIALRRCMACHSNDVFLFDRCNHPGKRSQSFGFIDFFQGHGLEVYGQDEPDLLHEANALSRIELHSFEDECSDLGGKVLDRNVVNELSEFALSSENYKSPGYLRSELNTFLKSCKDGSSRIWWLQAPGHIGKSTFISGLDPRHRNSLKEKPLAGNPWTVVFYVRREYRNSLEQFRHTLQRQLEDELNVVPGTNGLPQLKIEADKPSQNLIEWLAKFRAAAGNQRCLLICIDGLDELSPVEESERSIADFLPSPNEVPDGIYFLITSRPVEKLAPWLRRRLANRLEKSSTYTVTTDLSSYQSLLRAYFNERMNGVIDAWKKNPKSVNGNGKPNPNVLFRETIKQADGLFLYLAYISDLLANTSLQYEQIKHLPPPDRMFGHFLDQIEATHRNHTKMGGLFIRILVHLSAAAEAYELDKKSLPLDQDDWHGLPLDILSLRCNGNGQGIISPPLAYALYSLKPILGSWKEGDERQARFYLGPAGVTKIVRERYAEHVMSAHRVLAENILKRFELETSISPPATVSLRRGLWNEIDLNSSEQWQLRYLAAHIVESNTDLEKVLKEYKNGIIALCDYVQDRAIDLQKSQRHREAIRIYQVRICLLEQLKAFMANSFPSEWDERLASSYSNRGDALSNFGDSLNAERDFTVAIGIRRKLRLRLRKQWPLESIEKLAADYMNRGKNQSLTGNVKAMLASYKHAVRLREILRHRMDSHWEAEWMNNLAGAYGNYGNALRSMGRIPEAVVNLRRAIDLRQSLRCQYEGENWLRNWGNDLATAHMNTALALRSNGNYEEALLNYNESIKLQIDLQHEMGESWSLDCAYALALTYTNYGYALHQIAIKTQSEEKIVEAKNCFRLSTNLGQSLLDRLGDQCPLAWVRGIAGAYANEGAVLKDIGDLESARYAYDRAVLVLWTRKEKMKESWTSLRLIDDTLNTIQKELEDLHSIVTDRKLQIL
ncbi:tetratricopeptide repeat protein [Propionivibrio dicarboxylicus]|uniref:tetratricopeptide repeat protein n=1 Tax=Propionivibrio dicarboxylicus TaxID=83767 RepID=UPI00115F9573|nr:tetratricopeptide repeat protein [Propionivibrio dicarboxylicus]